MWSAAISNKDGILDVGVPKPLFDGKMLDKQTRVLDYDPEGARFLIAAKDVSPEEPRLVLVSDWRPDVAGSHPATK